MRSVILIAISLLAASVGADVRPAAVAGGFYTADPDALRTEVESLLETARADAKGPVARAIVVPHAGYVYSGPTAATAFVRLPREGIERVILLGPSHHYRYGGGALPDSDITAFATPLGEVPLDAAALKKLRRSTEFAGPPEAHDREHSLEVELPFIQLVAPEAKLVPIVVGADTDLDRSMAMARELAKLLDDGTVVLASSDFTHHGRRYGWSPYDGPDLPDTLLDVGRMTAGRAAAIDPRGFLKQVDVSGDTVCGVRPIGVLLALLAHAFDGDGDLLEVTTSGHVSGRFDLSVTYAAVAYSGDWSKWSEDEGVRSSDLDPADGQALVELARAALRTRLEHTTELAEWFETHESDGFEMPAGAFVTLNNTGRRVEETGRLRACMGVIEAEQPLVDAVIQAAVWATQDPRFPPLEASELDEIEVEVSVLSPMRPVRSYRDIEVGTHGVLLTKQGQRAVFLPQVATEQGWSRSTMLEHLATKAGLPADGWRDGAEFRVFTAQVFEEHR